MGQTTNDGTNILKLDMEHGGDTQTIGEVTNILKLGQPIWMGLTFQNWDIQQGMWLTFWN